MVKPWTMRRGMVSPPYSLRTISVIASVEMWPAMILSMTPPDPIAFRMFDRSPR